MGTERLGDFDPSEVLGQSRDSPQNFQKPIKPDIQTQFPADKRIFQGA